METVAIRPRVRVLLIDDDEDYYVITRDFLGDVEGYSCVVTWKSSFEEGLAELDRVDYDVCLLDFQLGARNGLELLRQAATRGCRIPVIMLTGQGDLSIDLEAMKAGAADYLIKGKIDSSLLERAIRYALERTRTLEQLRSSRDSLHATKEKLEEALNNINEELETAKMVQKSFLPNRIGVTPGLELAATFLPSGSIGGDLYDIIKIDENRLALLLFDVCGHGVPAALISAMAKVSFARQILQTGAPDQILREVNNELVSFMPNERYLTAFLGIFDIAKRQFLFSRAGHPPAILVRRSTNAVEYLSCKGAFVGLYPDARYDCASVALEQGDTIVLYTDGIIESMAGSGDRFGKDRLATALIQSSGADPSDTITTLIAEWNAFVGNEPQADDITLLVARVK
jgi:sigma-B regulation protein RsbU (phosphoserine phosphatase)